jgi:hypothetical protein
MELVILYENCWHAKENMNQIQSLQKYQQDDKCKMKSLNKGDLVLWMLKVMKIKGEKFRLPWKGPYKMQKTFQ